ncbi:MAG TPA: family membership, partial [Thermoanaerobaculia bacterium]|nr:family membership [Thermoanaerobaculia bacterium]
MRRLLKKTLLVLATLATLGVLAIAVLYVFLRLEHNTPLELPRPTGPFAVGRATYTWRDPSQTEAFAATPGTKREFLAWIWYPAVPRHSPPVPEDYLPVSLRTAIEHQRVGLINLLTRDFSRVRSHSIRDADVSPKDRSYPVVVMIGSVAFTTLAEDLASHGYIVVSVEAAYRNSIVAFPDGRVIHGSQENNPETLAGKEKEQLAIKLQNAASADIGLALDQLARLNASDPSGKFTGRLDLNRVGVFGHSLGGAMALQFCHDDPRCGAVVDLDGAPHGIVINEGVPHPVMFLLSDHGSDADPDSLKIKANVRSILDRLPSDKKLQIAILGANHFSFSDDAVL